MFNSEHLLAFLNFQKPHKISNLDCLHFSKASSERIGLSIFNQTRKIDVPMLITETKLCSLSFYSTFRFSTKYNKTDFFKG